MKIVKKVKIIAQLNDWKMWELMGKDSLQAYQHLERKGKRLLPSDFLRLRGLFPGTDSEFLALIRQCGDK